MRLHRRSLIKTKSLHRQGALLRQNSSLPADTSTCQLQDIPHSIISLICKWCSPDTRTVLLKTSKALAECLLSSEHVNVTLTIDPTKANKVLKGARQLPRTIAWASGLAGSRLRLEVCTPRQQEAPRLLSRLLGTELTLDRAVAAFHLGGSAALQKLTRLDLRVSVPFPGASSPWISGHQLALTCPSLTHLSLFTWGSNPEPLRMAYGCSHLQTLELETDTRYRARRTSSGPGSGPFSNSGSGYGSEASPPGSGCLSGPSSTGSGYVSGPSSSGPGASSISALTSTNSGSSTSPDTPATGPGSRSSSPGTTPGASSTWGPNYSSSGPSYSSGPSATSASDGSIPSPGAAVRGSNSCAGGAAGALCWGSDGGAAGGTAAAAPAGQVRLISEQLPSLQSLTLKGEWMAAAAVAPLAAQLTSLQVSPEYVGTASQLIVEVAACSHLRQLALTGLNKQPHQQQQHYQPQQQVLPQLPITDALVTWATWLTCLTSLRLDGYQIGNEDFRALLAFPQLTHVTGHNLRLTTSFAASPCSWHELQLTSTEGLCEPTCCLGCLPAGGQLTVRFTQRLLVQSGARERGSLRTQLQQAAVNISKAPGGRCVLPGVSLDGRPFNWGEEPPYHNPTAAFLEPLLAITGPQSPELELALMPIGDTTITMLSRCCGDTLRVLTLSCCTLDASFWASKVLTQLPELQRLRFRMHGRWDAGVTLEDVVRFCQSAEEKVQVSFEFELDRQLVGPTPAARLVAALLAWVPHADADVVGGSKAEVRLHGWEPEPASG